MKLARALALALAGAASACVGLNVGAGEGCAEACATALACGFLPSVLGWSTDPEDAAAESDCLRRCANSPRESGDAAAILTCLEGQGDAEWCAGDDEDAAQWSICAGALACLDREFGRHYLAGEAHATVHLIGKNDYERLTGATVAAIYAARGDVALADPGAPRTITSCAPALCGQSQRCRARGEQLCDPTLCNQDLPPPSQACMSMALRRVAVHAVQNSGQAASILVYESEEPDGASCMKLAPASFDGESSRLVPGPVEFSAQVRGELTAGELAALGQPGAADLDPATVRPYCVEYFGPTTLLRAGENEAVIPVFSPAEYASDPATGWTMTFCPV